MNWTLAKLVSASQISRWRRGRPSFFNFNEATGVLQSTPDLRKLRDAVGHPKRTTPVDAGQGLGRTINSRTIVRSVGRETATADEVGRQRGLGGWPWEPSRYCRTSGLLEAGGIR